MADYPDRPGYSFNPGPPPEASRFLKNKGLKPSFSWLDVEPEEHAVAFAVAKMAEIDLLEAAKAEVRRALDDGLTFETFKKNWLARPGLADWLGKREYEDPLTGDLVEIRRSPARRLKVIYDANLRSARAAGQWERIERTKAAFPFLEYRTGPSEQHRPLHVEKAGMIIATDSPFWDEWMPPNGWGCKCWVRQVTRREAERRGITPAPEVPDTTFVNPRTGDVQIVPLGIDPGWQRNPGLLRRQGMEALLADKIEALPANVAETALRDIASSWRVKRILSQEAPGTAPIAILPQDIADRLGAKTTIIRVSASTAEKQADKHPELSVIDYEVLVALIANAEVYAQKETHIAFIGDGDQPWIAIVKRTLDATEMYLTSLYRAASARYVQRVKSRGERWR